jgi:hypothetical protein
MSLEIKASLGCIVIYFAILYLVAWFANRNYRDKDDILGISKLQWRAIMLIWLPSIVVIIKSLIDS